MRILWNGIKCILSMCWCVRVLFLDEYAFSLLQANRKGPMLVCADWIFSIFPFNFKLFSLWCFLSQWHYPCSIILFRLALNLSAPPSIITTTFLHFFFFPLLYIFAHFICENGFRWLRMLFYAFYVSDSSMGIYLNLYIVYRKQRKWI